MLSEHDYSQVLEAVRRIAEVSDPERFGSVVVNEVARVVESDITSLNDVDPAEGRFTFVMQPESFTAPPGVVEALTELADEHPLIRYASETGDGSAHKISDFWSTDVWHRSALYQRVYGPMGVEHQMSITLPAARPTVIGLAVNRSATDFSERDRAVLNQLRPHLAQGWRQSREHARLRSLIDTAAGALVVDGTQVVLLTDPVHELTPGALIDLYRYFGRPPAATPLPARVARWLERERAASRHSVVGVLARPLTATRGERQLVVRYLPAADGRPDALLLRSTISRDLGPRLVALGLSPRETEVLGQLTSGATNAEIAQRLHVAASTVKRHLDHIYVKLGVTGRVQATAVALAAVAHQPPPGH